KFPRLKEWAYAGLAFDVIGAIYSISMVRQTVAIIPIIALIFVFTSYFLYHKRVSLIPEI
ncbi:MAG TPA: DoxX family protein, partial [Oscillospiraceae bacterium]|nr:DoxX family protein [Oscillospiraceae bacterium]